MEIDNYLYDPRYITKEEAESYILDFSHNTEKHIQAWFDACAEVRKKLESLGNPPGKISK